MMGNWNIGNDLLTTIKYMILYHSQSSIFGDVVQVLELMALHYKDLDIRDRAHIYYQLVTRVTGDKLLYLLREEQLGDGAKSGLVKTLNQFNSNASNDSMLLKQIKSTYMVPFELLQMQRLAHENTTSLTLFTISQQEQATEESLFEQYMKHVKSLKLCIPFTYQLSLNASAAVPSDAPLSDWSKLYSLVVQFNVAAHCKKMKPMRVPYLTTHSGGPASATIHIQWVPILPIPAPIECIVQCTASNGMTCICKLPPLPVSFRDLFIPLAAQPINAAFDLLWQHLPMQSIKVVTNSSDTQFAQFLTELLKYQCQTDCYAMTLAPHYHLAFKVEWPALPHKPHIIVHVKTDLWQTLAFIDSFIA